MEDGIYNASGGRERYIELCHAEKVEALVCGMLGATTHGVYTHVRWGQRAIIGPCHCLTGHRMHRPESLSSCWCRRLGLACHANITWPSLQVGVGAVLVKVLSRDTLPHKRLLGSVYLSNRMAGFSIIVLFSFVFRMFRSKSLSISTHSLALPVVQ